MNRIAKQTITITFSADTETLADEAFDCIYDFCNKEGGELEFVHCTKADNGFDIEWKYTAQAPCEYYPGNELEPDEYDYDELIDPDYIKHWFTSFMESKNLFDEEISDIFVDEDIDIQFDDRG